MAEARARTIKRVGVTIGDLGHGGASHVRPGREAV
jgi:hypothetical protein